MRIHEEGRNCETNIIAICAGDEEDRYASDTHDIHGRETEMSTSDRTTHGDCAAAHQTLAGRNKIHPYVTTVDDLPADEPSQLTANGDDNLRVGTAAGNASPPPVDVAAAQQLPEVTLSANPEQPLAVLREQEKVWRKMPPRAQIEDAAVCKWAKTTIAKNTIANAAVVSGEPYCFNSSGTMHVSAAEVSI